MSGGEGFPFPINMKREAWHSLQTETQLNKKPKFSSAPTPPIPNLHVRNRNFKTQMCRKFRQGVCGFGSKCNYAHSLGELRRQQGIVTTFQQQPKLCRMFFHNKHCSYGLTCRFLHVFSTSTSTSRDAQEFKNATSDSPKTKTVMLNLNNANPFGNISHGHGQTELGKLDGFSSAEYRAMQTSTAATDASTSRVATSSLHKNESYGTGVVKFIFKKNELQKISRIYADWI